MSVADTQAAANQAKTAVVNDFSILAATVNGSGSQTANNVIVRALFRMGIPVSGKNFFPSNIKGLPTWYQIRVSKDGYTARQEKAAILVTMNMSTIAEDVEKVVPGGVVMYPDDWKISFSRDDLTYYPMPVKQVIDESDTPRGLKDYVANMVYVGVVAELLGIPIEYIKDAISYYLGGKEKAINLNLGVVEAAEAFVRENLTKQDPYRVEPMDKTGGMIMIDGNTAAGLGAVFGGVNVIAWYPITPSTSLVDAARDYLKALRCEEEGATYAIVQAEDELAAIGMVLGAGWAGARSMTATSGPGISLMAEFTGLGYFAELPGVIWNVQRTGPSTGLPTRTSQGDLLFTYFLGHGDSRQVLLLPGNMEEIFEFGWRSFDLAEHLQTPIFVLSDLDLGMNHWMSHRFEYPDEPMDRGKVLSAEDLEKMDVFARFVDTDGDGIGYRTLPGTPNPKAAYFTRGTGHDEFAVYSERPDKYVENIERLQRKFATARTLVPKPIIEAEDGAEIAVVCYGSVDAALEEARDILRDEHNIKTDYMRIRALPFTADVLDFIKAHDKIYVVEANTDGQLAQIMRMEVPEQSTHIHSIAYLDGLPLTAPFVAESLLAQEG